MDEEENVPDILEEVFQLKKHHSAAREEERKAEASFEIVEEAKGAEATLDDFEHLSQYDPEDEFLRSSRSVSIIESIMSRKSVSQTSDFSLVSAGKRSVISVGSLRSKNTIAFVESNRDVYQEDVITQKIIYYVSLFSEDVSAHLRTIRSKKALATEQPQQAEDFLIDLDDVDAAFVHLILDVLEYYELFRLCLMVCNRYHMSERLGRYVISVCAKYSNLHAFRFDLARLKSSQVNALWRERQRCASIIAHEAIHNVFALVEPRFLALKDVGEPVTAENSLGPETYRMMVDLGFWKKAVYTHAGFVGLLLCHWFFDRDNFELLADSLPGLAADAEKQAAVARMGRELLFREFLLHVHQTRALAQVDVTHKTALRSFLQEAEPALVPLAQVVRWLY